MIVEWSAAFFLTLPLRGSLLLDCTIGDERCEHISTIDAPSAERVLRQRAPKPSLARHSKTLPSPSCAPYLMIPVGIPSGRGACQLNGIWMHAEAPRRPRVSVVRSIGLGRATQVSTLALAVVIAGSTAAGELIAADVVVVGGTPAGIAASIAAAREGRSIILLERTQYLGGLPANGLGATDLALGVRASTQAPATADGNAMVSFRNTFASLEKVTVAPLALGSERSEEPTLQSNLSPVLYEIDVAPGTSKITADVDLPSAASPTSPQANISLVIFYFTGQEMSPVASVAYDIGPGARKHVELKDPKPGKYKVGLDAWGVVSAGGLRVRYRDAVYHTMYGKVHVEDTASDLKQSETKTAPVHFEVDNHPAKDRRLIAEVGLFCERCVSTAISPNWREQSFAARVSGKPEPPAAVATEPVPIATQTILLPEGI